MSDRRLPTEPFREFCAALNHHDVDYVVIGSEAVAFHGVPRFSVDFDVFVRPTTANLLRVKAALTSAAESPGAPARLTSCWAVSAVPRMMPACVIAGDVSVGEFIAFALEARAGEKTYVVTSSCRQDSSAGAT